MTRTCVFPEWAVLCRRVSENGHDVELRSRGYQEKGIEMNGNHKYLSDSRGSGGRTPNERAFAFAPIAVTARGRRIESHHQII